MHPILIIARLTLREAVRRRVLLAVILATVAAAGFTTWGFAKLAALTGPDGGPMPVGQARLNEAMFLLLVAYGFSTVLAGGAAFLAAPAIAADVESGLAQALLPRPIRRSDLVLGRWIGLAALLVVYACGTGALEMSLVRAVTGYLPPRPVAAMLFLSGEGVVVLTMALLCSTRMAPVTSGLVALALFGVAWIAGAAESIGAVFNSVAIVNAGRVIGFLVPSDGLWRGVAYHMEPAMVAAMASSANGVTPFTATEPPSLAYVAWSGAWVAAILALAAVSFHRRDL